MWFWKWWWWGGERGCSQMLLERNILPIFLFAPVSAVSILIPNGLISFQLYCFSTCCSFNKNSSGSLSGWSVCFLSQQHDFLFISACVSSNINIYFVRPTFEHESTLYLCCHTEHTHMHKKLQLRTHMHTRSLNWVCHCLRKTWTSHPRRG